MKTLVIHPKDSSTDFLSVIYSDKDWTVITFSPNISKRELTEQIKNHDRIIMLGHGTEHGLCDFKNKKFVIDSSWVYLLRQKQCICIWCNANKFVEKYDLKGFYTGMIISEFEEAMMCCVSCEYNHIQESNTLFSDSVKKSINSLDMFSEMNISYVASENPIVDFNRQNIYQR